MRTHQVGAEGKIGALVVIMPTRFDSVADYEDDAGDLDDASVSHGSIGRLHSSTNLPAVCRGRVGEAIAGWHKSNGRRRLSWGRRWQWRVGGCVGGHESSRRTATSARPQRGRKGRGRRRPRAPAERGSWWCSGLRDIVGCKTNCPWLMVRLID